MASHASSEKGADSKGAMPLATFVPSTEDVLPFAGAQQVVYQPQNKVYLGSFSPNYHGNLASIIDEETYASSISRVNDAMQIPPGGSYTTARNISIFLRFGTLIPLLVLMFILVSRSNENGVPIEFYFVIFGNSAVQLIGWFTLVYARNQWKMAFNDMVKETTAVISVLNSEQNGLAQWLFAPPHYQEFSWAEQNCGCQAQFAAVLRSTAATLHVMRVGAQQV